VAFFDGTHGPPVPQDLGLVTVTVQVSVADSHEEVGHAAAELELSSSGQMVVDTATTEVKT